MNVKSLSVTLGLALAAMSAPAIAGGFDRDAPPGYRAPRGTSGVPVPAPMPIPETFSWYLRADVGLGINTAPGVSEAGRMFGAGETTSPFGMSNAWFNKDFDTSLNWGLGVGYYLSPRWRADVTVDQRSRDSVAINGGYSYTITTPGLAAPLVPGSRVDGFVSDRTTSSSTFGLLNLYYDLTDRGRFTPYVGAGLGFTANWVERQHEGRETIVNCCGLAVGERHYTGKTQFTDVALAGMVTTGVAITLWPSTVVDLNYRLVYLGGSDITVALQNGQASKLSIDDLFEHQLRAGLRWNIW